MADKSVGELIAAQSVTPTDLFVLEQNGTAKKLTGQILENWLVSFADGHGGIQSIKKLSTSGLADTYRITLADTTTFDFVVTNGRSITGISKTGTSGLVDTYTISYNNGTTSTFTVKNGKKGDKGDNAYTWIKYASQQPTAAIHSMGDIPDAWMGIYTGTLAAAPTDWTLYKWYKIKGEQGKTGEKAILLSTEIVYQSSDSGTIIPSGAWSTSIPVVAQGKYLWKRTTRKFNSGEPEVSYDVNRMGIDGSGSVSSVAGVSPDATGNVTLTAADVGALAVSGGDVTGEIRMNGQPISGLNDPTDDTQAARKGYVDASVRKAAPRNLLDNSDFRNPVNQRDVSSWNTISYGIDRWFTNGTSANISVTRNGLQGSADFLVQKFEKIKLNGALKVTAVVQVNGTIYFGVLDISNFTSGSDIVVITDIPGISRVNLCHEDDDICQFYFAGINSVTIEWAALYAGEYTKDTLPEYHSKGYTTELLECKRYYMNLFLGGNTGFVASSLNTAYFNVMIPVSMRVSPTATSTNSDMNLVGLDNRGQPIVVTTTGVTVGNFNGGIRVNLTGDFSSFCPYTPISCFAYEIALSADL